MRREYQRTTLWLLLDPQRRFTLLNFILRESITKTQFFCDFSDPHLVWCQFSWTHLNRLMTKPTKWQVRIAKTQISLGILPVWSESSLSAWRKLGSLANHWVHSEDSDQTGRMPRLIWVFAGRTAILLILSWGGSNLTSCLQYPQHIFLWSNKQNYPLTITKYPPYLFHCVVLIGSIKYIP